MTSCYIWHSSNDTDAAKRIRAEIMDMCRVQCTLSSDGKMSDRPSVHILLYSRFINNDTTALDQIRKLKINGLPILLCLDECAPNKEIMENKIIFRWTNLQQKDSFFTLVNSIVEQEAVTGKALSLYNEAIPEYTPTTEDVLNRDSIDRLAKLSQMFTDGLLSETEYTTLKGSIVEACRVHLDHLIEAREKNGSSDSKYSPKYDSKPEDTYCNPSNHNDPMVMNLDSKVISRLKSLGKKGSINISPSESRETPYKLEITSFCPGKSVIEIGGVVVKNAGGRCKIGYCDAQQAVVIKEVLSSVGASAKISISDDMSPVKLYTYTNFYTWEVHVRQDYNNRRGQAIANGIWENGERLSDAVVVARFEKAHLEHMTKMTNDISAFTYDVAKEYGLSDDQIKEVKFSSLDKTKISFYDGRIHGFRSAMYTDAESLCMYELVTSPSIYGHIKPNTSTHGQDKVERFLDKADMASDKFDKIFNIVFFGFIIALAIYYFLFS